MISRKTKVFLAASAILLTPLAHAVENRAALPLWFETVDLDYGTIEQFNSVDIAPNTIGIEVPGYNESVSAQTTGSTARMVWRQRLQFRKADTTSNKGQFTITVKSEPYPIDDINHDYFCGDEFSADLNPDNTIPNCDVTAAFGVAQTAGGGRYLVWATSAILDYFGNTNGVSDVYKIHVFNLATGSLVWGKSWKLETPAGSGAPWELDVSLSAVGDFLNADGTDELRVMQIRPVANNNLRTRYTYYDITNGNQILVNSFSVPQP